MREVQGDRVRRNAQMYKPLTQNIRVGCLVWYFDPRIIPGTSHKLRLFWAGPYRVSKLIAPSLAEIKPVYYPVESRILKEKHLPSSNSATAGQLPEPVIRLV